MSLRGTRAPLPAAARTRRVRTRLGTAVLGSVAAVLVVLVVQGLRTATGEYLPAPDYDVTLRLGEGDGAPVRLAVVGDSTVDGIGSLTPRESLAALVAERLAGILASEVVVAGFGRSGARTADVAGLAAELPAWEPDVVLVVIGSNDATHALPSWRMRGATREMLAALSARAGDAPVVLGGIPEFHTVPAVPQPLRWLLATHADVLRRQQAAGAADAGVPFVDIRALASPRFLDRPESMSVDGFHPSALGYGFWADALAPVLAHALEGGTLRRR